MTAARVRRVDPEVVRPLRQRVLRPHQTIEEQVFAGDDDPRAAHFAAYPDDDDAEHAIGIASITPEGGPGAFRVRGMATDPERGRGTGAGGALLLACLEHAREQGATRVWCNARTPARGFYERYGFVAEGAEFELPEIGPHHVMSLRS
ncbi:MAG TPA: GNAT family N-acetyltransferase [Baekduia sp.]|uniref:GNAT family N-acetyltransferase n=1 Tax=Baekduia sp. TaxID=2600305 RepID=UPI002D77E1DC|nr:GNAT family N-acetyltransferase [Baekduia sp.]HET6506780.1 GNAT family N-acetyltransferase [Baekduia sp.]